MLRTSSSYGLPSSLARSKIRDWDGPLSDIFRRHSEPYVLAHFRNINRSTKWTMLYLLYWDVERLWHSHRGEEEFRNSENCFPVTWYPLGDSLPAWLLVWTTWATPAAVRQILKPLVAAIWSGQQTAWGLQLCMLLSFYSRTCKFVGSPWGGQTLAYFKTLLCRQGKQYFSTNQGQLQWEMVEPASLEVFRSRMGSFPEDVF